MGTLAVGVVEMSNQLALLIRVGGDSCGKGQVVLRTGSQAQSPWAVSLTEWLCEESS